MGLWAEQAKIEDEVAKLMGESSSSHMPHSVKRRVFSNAIKVCTAGTRVVAFSYCDSLLLDIGKHFVCDYYYFYYYFSATITNSQYYYCVRAKLLCHSITHRHLAPAPPPLPSRNRRTVYL